MDIVNTITRGICGINNIINDARQGVGDFIAGRTQEEIEELQRLHLEEVKRNYGT
jgi:hypothetical protein